MWVNILRPSYRNPIQRQPFNQYSLIFYTSVFSNKPWKSDKKTADSTTEVSTNKSDPMLTNYQEKGQLNYGKLLEAPLVNQITLLKICAFIEQESWDNVDKWSGPLSINSFEKQTRGHMSQCIKQKIARNMTLEEFQAR